MPSPRVLLGQLLRAIALSLFLIAIPAAVLPAQAQTPTTTVLEVSVASSTFGQAVDLTATVSDSSATGKVTFYAGTTVLGTRSLAGGTAALETILLPTGVSELRARYLGDSARAASTSPVVPHTVVVTAAGGLAPPVVYGGMNDPRGIAVADFNNDGVEDAIVADNLLRAAHVLLGNPGGTFQAPLSASTLHQPLGVAVGDLNEDGNTDAVLPHDSGGSISVLLGNGDGTFGPVSHHASGTGTVGIGVGDLNGDGHLDVIAVNIRSGNLGVLLGNGDGTLQAAVSYPVGTGAFRVAVADFNEDGYADLAAATGISNTAVVLLNDGSGAFPTIVAFPVPGNPIDVAAADLDDDGDVDLVLGLAGTSVSVLLNDGTGTFQPPVNYPSTTFVRAVGTADLNGDGRHDVFASGDSGLGLLYGNGDGTLAPANHYGSTSGATDAAVGDFNGDGRPDLAIAVGALAINVALALPAQIVFTSADQTTFTVTTSGSFTFTATGVPPPTFSVAPALPTGLTLTPSGVLSGTPAPGTAGVYNLVVTASNGVDLDATQDFTLTVARIPQTITFPNPGPQFTLVSSGLAVSASSGLPVSLESLTPEVCSVWTPGTGVGFRSHIGGTCTMVARQLGSETYLPAAPNTQSWTIRRRPQTIVFTNPGTQPVHTSITLTAYASDPARPATLSSETPTVCTLTSNLAQLFAIGTCRIVARHPGDGVYLPAADVTQSFEVALGLPHPPENVSVSANGNFVTLRWTPAGEGPAADAFLVEVGDGPGRTSITSVLTTELGDTGLLPLGEYYLRVRAQNAAGLSERSDEVWVRVTGTLPVALPPVGPSVSVAGSTVAFSWTPAAAGAPPETYLVQIGTDPLSGELARVTVPAGSNAFTVPNAPPGTYAMRVRAITSAGPSPPSPAIWLRVGSATPCSSAPKSPLMLTPVISDHMVGLSWLPPADTSAKSFVVQADSGSGLSDLITVDVGAIGGLGASAGDGAYVIRALSTSDCGTSAPSVEQTVTIGGPAPAAPTGLVATPGPGGVTFTWTPAASGAAATHFVVEAGLTTGTTLIKFPVGSTPSLTVPGVPSGVTFVARVRGANASGIGAASAEIVVTVP